MVFKVVWKTIRLSVATFREFKFNKKHSVYFFNITVILVDFCYFAGYCLKLDIKVLQK